MVLFRASRHPPLDHRRRARLALLGLIATLLTSPVLATSFIRVSDEELADQAPVIAQVRILAIHPGPSGELPSTRYEVEVGHLIKGHLPGSRVIVRVLGGVTPDGEGLEVFGVPRLGLGERVLLFLSPRQDGSYGIVHLMLGSFFEQVEPGGSRIAVRDLSEAHEVRPAGAASSETPETARDLERFVAWLEDRAAGVERPADYRIELATPALRRTQDRFVFLGDGGGCPDGQQLDFRWFKFDQSQSARWLANASGQPGMTGGGFTELRNALDAWQGDTGSQILLSWGGTTSAISGSGGGDGLIVFDDPGGEIPGSFRCSGGGVLAIGGASFRCNALPFNGKSYREAVAGFIVTQDGAGCHFGSGGGKNGEEVFAHELGHTLGLGHSSVSGALMRAIAYGDGRGARLGADDRQGIAILYGSGGGGGGGDGGSASVPPAAPSTLSAQALSQSQIRLQWTDTADNEAQFEVEIGSGFSFRRLGTVPADTTTALVSSLEPATFYTFRLRACNGAGCSSYSNQASARTPEVFQLPAAPSGLAAKALSATQIRLSWRDNASNESSFRVEMQSPEGFGFREVASMGANATTSIVGGLAAGTEYSFRVRACNAAGCSSTSALASARTENGGGQPSCSLDPNALCLAGGRFAVGVDWVNQRAGGERGVGKPISDSDDSGFFWFFDPANLELVVKVLDGRTINDHFWLFYGALSDVEYTLTVTDNETGTRKIYRNRPGELCGRGDVTAFPDAAAQTGPPVSGLALGPAPAPRPIPVLLDGPHEPLAEISAGSCQPGAETLCLLDGRFAVRVDWTNQRQPGQRGPGKVVPRTDKSGTFWFFDPDNIELVVKMLDGRAVNGRFWLFYGALSDLDYTLRVEDTVSREVKTYRNRPGEICGLGDVSAF